MMYKHINTELTVGKRDSTMGDTHTRNHTRTHTGTQPAHIRALAHKHMRAPTYTRAHTLIHARGTHTERA